MTLRTHPDGSDFHKVGWNLTGGARIHRLCSFNGSTGDGWGRRFTFDAGGFTIRFPYPSLDDSLRCAVRFDDVLKSESFIGVFALNEFTGDREIDTAGVDSIEKDRLAVDEGKVLADVCGGLSDECCNLRLGHFEFFNETGDGVSLVDVAQGESFDVLVKFHFFGLGTGGLGDDTGNGGQACADRLSAAPVADKNFVSIADVAYD